MSSPNQVPRLSCFNKKRVGNLFFIQSLNKKLYFSCFQGTYIFQDSANTFLITLGNHGSVVKVDTRVGVLPVATYHLLDKSHAKSISCHPLQSHLLLTGTNKGGCSIFDLRSCPASNGLLVPATSLLGATRFEIFERHFSSISNP